MAEGSDAEDRTEAPTEKKLADASKRGDVPVAADLKHLAMLSAALAMFAGGGASSMMVLGGLCRSLWSRADMILLTQEGAQAFLQPLLASVGQSLMVPLGMCLGAALIGGVLQGKIVVSATRITPQLSRISPVAGLKRLLGVQGLIQFAKTLAKLAAIGWAVWATLWPQTSSLPYLSSTPLIGTAAMTTNGIHALLKAVVVAAAVLALVDFATSRIQFLKRMRMTRDEVRDEIKSSDGDPHIKSKLKAIRMQRGRRRMLAQVPKAAVVVMNPTHYAVALAYDHGVSAAPTVVARGVDRVALAIRAKAEEAGVAVVVDPPLARSLYAAAKIDHPIPVEFYRAVAEVISFVMRTAARQRRG